MTRNYDSSVPGRPYIRVTDLALSYDQRQNALVGYTDQRAVPTDAGAVEHLAGPGAQRRGAFEITPQMWPQAIPMVVNPTTGATSAAKSSRSSARSRASSAAHVHGLERQTLHVTSSAAVVVFSFVS